MAVRILMFFCALLVAATRVWALDPPHDASQSIVCVSCHALHNAPGGVLNTAVGNSNVCLTCHVPTGQASERPFVATEQAMPPLPRATGWTAGSGKSHRYDSGPGGHVKRVAGNTSTGTISSIGNFSGRIEDEYLITIATGGNVGTATFTWTSLWDGSSGSATTSAATVGIGSKGLQLKFTNGGSTPSFVAGNQWALYARTDIRRPDATVALEFPLALRMMEGTVTRSGGVVVDVNNGMVSCSTCHDQHSQENLPFDSAAPAYSGPGSGWTATAIGRHLQRQNNDSNQMCKICHSARNVTSSSQGSHPVGITLPAGDFRTPPALPLGATKVECLSCHAPHFVDSGGANSGAGDGFILRQAIGDLCFQCHTNADRSNGAHFNQTTGVLWGGNRNRAANATQRFDALSATSFPKHTSDKRGFCINCHWPHGWPNSANTTQDYSKLWVEKYDSDRTTSTDGSTGEALCFACHTTPVSGVPASPATSDIEAEFARGSALSSATGDVFRHPVNDNEQQSGRRVECVDCHNPHKATNTDRHAGVAGVDLDGNTVAAGSRALVQYELCFKCHGDTFNSARPNTSNKRLDFNTTAANSAYHPVAQAGRNVSANLAAQLRGGLTTSSTIRCTDCHNSSAFSAQVGKINDSTSVTVGPHGSANAPILRAQFGRSYTSTGWSSANGNLCFGCHLSSALFGSNSNFHDGAGPSGSKGKGNLHDYHLNNKSVTASCMSCHYDIHSNRTASNTEYCVGTSIGSCTMTTSPPANVKSHLINFAPDVTGLNYSKPRWHINTSTGVRTCDLTCHGSSNKMDRVTYKPSSGDDTYTY